MRSGYTRHLTRVIGVDMVQGSQEHEGGQCSGPLNIYDSGSQYKVVAAIAVGGHRSVLNNFSRKKRLSV